MSWHCLKCFGSNQPGSSVSCDCKDRPVNSFARIAMEFTHAEWELIHEALCHQRVEFLKKGQERKRDGLVRLHRAISDRLTEYEVAANKQEDKK